MSLGLSSIILLLVALVFANDVGPNYNALTVNVNTWESKYGSYPFISYRSSNITCPAVRKAVDSPKCYDDNDIFLAIRGFRVPNPAVTILDNHGNLIWSRAVHGQPYNLKVQQYKGERVLTYWVGNDAIGGHGEGYFHVLNSRYQEIARIRGVNNLRADLHELTITPQGTALVTFYQIYPLYQPGLFKIKDNVYIWDCLFQEFDIATQQLLFEWRASDHHQLNESYALLGTDGYTVEHPYDWYHINSVEKDELGNFLVSARFTSSITYIDGKTGKIIWILGGKRNSFADLSNGQATNMAYQHMARFHPLTAFPKLMAKEISDHGVEKHKDGMTKQLLSAFDNGIESRPARGVLIELTYPSQAISTNAPYTAKLIQSYEHPLHIPSVSQGSMQLVNSNLTINDDPHILLGFGFTGIWTEHTADGTLLCDSRITTESAFGKGHVQSYSALKYKWTAQPSYPPTAVPSISKTSLFVSWNGATEVKSWQLRVQHLLKAESGSSAGSGVYHPVSKTSKAGFETEILLPEGSDRESVRYLYVEALDVDGKVLGKTEIVDLWESGFLSRISQMTPLSGSAVILISSMILIALVLVYTRSVRSSANAYQKLRKH